MKLAIHNNNLGFTNRWVNYCKSNGIPFVLVDGHADDIIKQVDDCDALLWHHWQTSTKDLLKAQSVLFALEHAGKVVFPNFKSSWHFDDKTAQKYLLEALKLPLVHSYHFVDEKEALSWAETTSFPKVFKLKRGAGSANVRLAKNKQEAIQLIKRAFRQGFPVYSPWASVKERYRKVKEGQDNWLGVLKSLYRVFYPPTYSKLLGQDRYNVYFQDFIPENSFDIRIIVIGGRAFAIKRLVRKGDFRASGSGNIEYGKENFPTDLVAKSFQYAATLDMQVVCFDYIFSPDGTSYIVEISCGYAIDGYDQCEGYWDVNMHYHEGKFDSCEWMVQVVMDQVRKKQSSN